MTQSLLEIQGLTKAFGQQAVLRGVDLSIEPGMHVGLLGNNGQGKTTLIKLILGLLRPDSGTISLNNQPVGFPRNREQKRNLGYLPEAVNFYPNLTGWDTLVFLAKLKGANTDEVSGLLELVGLTSAARTEVGNYSKGMRQRLGLAQALLGGPSMLLLDEPTNGLDPEGIREFYAILEQLQTRKVAILTASHLLAEIEPRLDCIVLLQDGRFGQQGTVRELVEQAKLPVRIRVVLQKPQGTLTQKLESMGATPSPNGHPHAYQVTCTENEKISVLDDLLKHRKNIEAISVREPGLEEVFHHYQTGGAVPEEDKR